MRKISKRGLYTKSDKKKPYIYFNRIGIHLTRYHIYSHFDNTLPAKRRLKLKTTLKQRKRKPSIIAL